MAAKTSLAVIVCRRFSRAKSLAQAVKYMIKMPLARAKAAEASLPTLVEEGKVCLRIRRTHARGGSNSTAEGGPLFCCLFSLSAVLAVLAASTVLAGAAGAAGLVGLMVVNGLGR